MQKQITGTSFRPRNIQNLLQELAIKEMESTQQKITQVINKQRTNYRETHISRQMKTSISKPSRKYHLNHKSDLVGSLQNPFAMKDKENVLLMPNQRTLEDLVINLTLDKGLPHSKPTQRRMNISTQRLAGKPSLLKKKDFPVDLPQIAPKLIRKSSLQDKCKLQENKNRKSDNEFSDFYDLATIEQEQRTPARQMRYDVTFKQLEKQFSWAPISNFQ